SGFLGILFIGLFAEESWNNIADGAFFGNVSLLGHQAVAAVVAPAYAFAGTYVLLRLIGLVTSLRVDVRSEALGLDIAQHGEEAYVLGDGAVLVSADAGHERAA